VERWRKQPCRFLTNRQGKRRKIDALQVAPASPRVVEKVTVYLEKDIKDIVDGMSQTQPEKQITVEKQKRWDRIAVHVDEDGREWLTDVQLARRYGQTRGLLWWADRDSRVRPGQKALRSKRIPNRVRQKGSPGEIRVYLDDDARDIIAGKESRHLGSGRGKNAARLRKEVMDRAKEAVYAALSSGQRPSTRCVLEQARKCGVSARAARKALELYGTYDEEGNRRRWKLIPVLAGSRKTEAVGQQQCMPSAASETHSDSRKIIAESLPQQPYPVYIVQPPDMLVPVEIIKRPADSQAPKWDSARRELWFDGICIKRFEKHPAHQQIAILEKFQADGWPPCVASPWPQDAETTLKTCQNLNAGLKEYAINKNLQLSTMIRFGGDGTGCICWKIAGGD
jgi:hypothetical protein